MRSSRLVTTLIALGLLSGARCTSEPVGGSASAVSGAGVVCPHPYDPEPCDNDTDDPVANTVVQLTLSTGTFGEATCSGILISPTAVLTAAQCVDAFAVNVGHHAGEEEHKTVANAYTVFNVDAPESIPDYGFTNVDPNGIAVDAGQDVGLVFLDAFVLASAYAYRPTFQSSLPSTIGPTPTDATNLGTSGWSNEMFRTNVFYGSQTLQVQAAYGYNGGFYYELQNGWRLDMQIFDGGGTYALPIFGDGGAPLYQLTSNAAQAGGDGSTFRDVVAVANSYEMRRGDTNEWPVYTDIVHGYLFNGQVQPPFASWIDQQMQDGTTVGSLTPHSASWLTFHGKTTSSWKGEVDYVGKCKNPYASGPVPTFDDIAQCIAAQGADCDCDHWLDEHDDCPFVYDPDQKDTNDQITYDRFTGDACRRCPCDPGNDIDGDGVCAVLCPGQPGPVDNCPFVANADQLNSNVDFEIANGQAQLGDACDPVPTPVPQVVFDNVAGPPPAGGCSQFSNVCTNPKAQTKCPSGCALNQDCVTCQCCGLSESNQIATTTVGPHVRNETLPVTAPVEVNVSVSDTVARFCQESPIDKVVCHGFTGAATTGGALPDDNHVLNDLQLSQTEPPTFTPASPWHKTTTTNAGPIGQLVFDFDATNRSYGDSSDFTRVWDYQGDLDRWLANPAFPIIPGCAGTDARCLGGIWWASAATDVGKTIDTVGTTKVGLHIEGNMYGNVADSITPIVPVSTVLWCPIPTVVVDPQPQGPHNWGPGKLAVLPHATSLQLDATVLPGDTRVLVASENGNVVAALQGDGSAVAAENIGSANCGGSSVNGIFHDALFDSKVSWFGAVEPSNAIAGSPDDAVAMSLDGTSLVAAAQTVGGVLQAAFVGSKPPGDPPAPRTDYSAAFSRWAGGVFVAGGQALSDATSLHDVWFGALDGTWSNVTPQAIGAISPIGDVQAITYSFADQRIWLVDRIPTAKKKSSFRLLRASPGGTLEQLAIWPAIGFAKSYFLSVDHDGAVLVSIAKSSGQGFVTARVEPNGTGGVDVTAVQVVAADALLAPTLVSPVGYTFLVQHGQTMKLLRVAHLTGTHRSLDEGLCQ